jgi:hypothetical protein
MCRPGKSSLALLVIPMAICVLGGPVIARSGVPDSAPASLPAGMTFLVHDDAAFIEGLRRHGMLRSYGYRVHNTGLDKKPFGERWLSSPLLEEARRSGKRYYLDRIAGGMPFQSLKGIEAVAAKLKGDPRFLGFQLHEWGNSPIHDYQRVNELLLKKGLAFDREHFTEYEGRIEAPYFGGGDFSVYEHVYRPLQTPADVRKYWEAYFREMSKRADGELMAVNGYYQLYHMALRLGAKNVMAEIGNQVPLTAMQIACVRGAARQYGKSFGVYYEPWGGAPFGCPCAIGWSPWLPGGDKPDNKLMGYQIRPELGSSRSLHRRLLYYSWLSGASWLAEEWGAENVFSSWKDYPLTEYGKVLKEFLEVTSKYRIVKPIVPAALVLPAGTTGIDLRYVSAQKDQLYEMMGPDDLHLRLRHFAREVLGTRPYKSGNDDFNLTPSQWIGSFDVLSADASVAVKARYRLLVFLDESVASQPPSVGQQVLRYTGQDEDSRKCIGVLEKLPGCRVEGEVGCARALTQENQGLIGLFNNSGVRKRNGKETTDPEETKKVVVRSIPGPIQYVVGGQFVTRRDGDRIDLAIPAGDVVVLLVPDKRGLAGDNQGTKSPARQSRNAGAQ